MAIVYGLPAVSCIWTVALAVNDIPSRSPFEVSTWTVAAVNFLSVTTWPCGTGVTPLEPVTPKNYRPLQLLGRGLVGLHDVGKGGIQRLAARRSHVGDELGDVAVVGLDRRTEGLLGGFRGPALLWRHQDARDVCRRRAGAGERRGRDTQHEDGDGGPATWILQRLSLRLWPRRCTVRSLCKIDNVRTDNYHDRNPVAQDERDRQPADRLVPGGRR